MRRKRLLPYAAALVSAALLLVAAPLSQAAAPKVKVAPFKPYRIDGQPIRSVTLTDFKQFSALSVADFPRLKADGVNMVTIYPYQFQTNGTSNSIASGLYTEPDAVLTATIKAAHTLGLQVQLIPTDWVGGTVGGFYWRGAIHPTDVNAWFNSYRTMVNHYATLAQKDGVELFGVGSEMISMEQYDSEWRQTIGEARQHYTGPLTYFTVYATVNRITWWNAIDYPGVSPYMSLASAEVPTYNDIANGWNKVHLPYLRQISKYVGKPLLVDEIGYSSAMGAATHPEVPGQGLPEEGLQKDLYTAFLDIVMKDKAVDGVSFYSWSAYGMGPVNAGFSPKGKPAECVLVSHWAAPGSTSATECSTLGRVVA